MNINRGHNASPVNSNLGPTFDKTSTSFTQSLNGFTEAQSANTLRNSISPISFPKAKRFYNPVAAAAGVPYYNTMSKNDKKKGAGFGFGK